MGAWSLAVAVSDQHTADDDWSVSHARTSLNTVSIETRRGTIFMDRLLDGDIVTTSASVTALVVGPYSRYFNGVYAVDSAGRYGLLTWGFDGTSLFIPGVSDDDPALSDTQHDDLKG